MQLRVPLTSIGVSEMGMWRDDNPHMSVAKLSAHLKCSTSTRYAAQEPKSISTYEIIN